jgi:MFS family permease
VISDHFRIEFSEARWIILAYLLSGTAVILAGGWLGDKFGRKKFLMWGLLVFSVSSLLAATSTQFIFLVISRLLQGAGGAVLMTMSLALIGDIAPKKSLGAATGMAGSLSASGTLLGPLLGSFFIYGFGWPSFRT